MDHIPYCQGPCRNGTQECPCPWACEKPDPDELHDTVEWAITLVLFASGAVTLGFLLMVML